MTEPELQEIRERWAVPSIPPELRTSEQEVATSEPVVLRLIDAAKTIPALLAEIDRLNDTLATARAHYPAIPR